MDYKRKLSRELCSMGEGALLMYAQDLQIEVERLQAENAQLERELAECKAKAIDYEVKRDVAVNTLDLVKAERTAAQKALAAQCTETKVLRQERYALAAQVLQMQQALELSYNLDITGVVFYDFDKLREEALALDTKPAESVINAVKDQALREAAEWLSTNTYVYGAKELYRRADELKKK